MARRSSNQSSNTPESPKEDTVSTTTEAAPEATSTEASPEATKKADEKPVDLTAFKAAVLEAVAGADPSTGELAAGVLEPVVKEYRAIEGLKGKNAAKAVLADGMRDAMNKSNIQAARSYLQMQDNMTAGSSGSSAPKAPADPTEAFVQSEATLRLAQELHTPGEGVSEDHEAKVEELVSSSRESAASYKAWLESDAEDKGEEPDVSAVVKNAVKLAAGKSAKAGGRASSGGTFTGERRDIGKHIAEAFAGVQSGAFLTVAEIRNHRSDEYGDNPPSAGAISARLFPQSGKCTVEGIEPGQNEKGNKGATKL
jgi:hypothetical protein